IEVSGVVAKPPVLDVITQKPTAQTDDELLANGVKLILGRTQHLTEGQQQQVVAVFTKYAIAWVRPVSGGAQEYAAKFVVEGAPIKQKLRHLTPELQGELERQVTAMLEAKVLQPSKSPWGSAPVFTRKKDGGWRLCLDYRQLNKQMKPDSYPLPLLWQAIQRAAHHNWYVCLDLNWGFWNLPLHPDSREFTAIITPKGLFEFLVLPFGIRNSPSEFQRMMDSALEGIQNLVVYIDDIVIFNNAFEGLLSTLGEVLERLIRKGLYLKLSKTLLFVKSVKMLGHIVSTEGIKPDPGKVKAVLAARPPKDKHELRSFLGTVSFLRRFIPNCSTLLAPLIELTKKSRRFEFSEACKSTFEMLKTYISENILLNAPRGSGRFVIVCDASNIGLGAALMQIQDRISVILELASRSLSPTERNWPTYEREAFAIRWAVGRFEDYIKTSHMLI
ncbi:MAG: reverse transcriptase family protein, partial [Sphingobacterium sp.]